MKDMTGPERSAKHGWVRWVNYHAGYCPVTKARHKLMDDLDERPDDQYLLGALPEYDDGGDQEAELCTCWRRGSFSHPDPDSNYNLTVAVDGGFVTREFDAESEAIDAIGEALLRKRELPDAVVTLVVSPAPDGQATEWAEWFDKLRQPVPDPEVVEEAITLIRTHVLDEGHELAIT